VFGVVGATGIAVALGAAGVPAVMGTEEVLGLGGFDGLVVATPNVSSSVTSSSKSRSKFSRVSIFRHSLTSLDVLEENVLVNY
jgi:hypothetical protein